MLINNRRLHRGDHLVRKGDPTETVEIVVSGRLRRDGSTEFTRGDCPGLIEGLMESGAVSTCWSGDIVAVRESRAVSLPLSLARAWVSNTRRLNILDRLLGSMCEAQLDRQQQRLTRLQRRKQTRLRACRRDASDNGIKENNDDDLGYAPDEDEKPVAHVTAWLTRQRRRNRSRLVGFEIDPTRFNLNELLHHLQLCLDAAHGTATAMVVSETDVERHFGRPADQLPDAALRNWLEDLELAFSVLVLVSTGPVTRWTRMVLGFLDCLVVCCDSNVAGADASGEVPSKAENFYSQMHLSRVHVAVFHPLTLRPVPEGTSLRFLRRRRWWARRVYHVRYSTGRYKPKPEGSAAKPAAQSAAQQPELASWISSHSDLARLTRCVTGAGVGLAFGSAAPRGLANFGVLEALLADGVAVDMIAGSGLGALTAAAWALHAGDIGATRAGLQRHWARIDSRWSRLRDLTLPLVATYTGAELNASLRQLFGDHRQAEDLWLPFVAVSTDLVAAQAVAHATGTLWRSVRASCGLVGAYPPVWEPRTGRLLLDGAHTDRMPARTLRRRLKARYVVAAALESKRRLRPGTYLVFGDAVSGFSELLRSLNPFRLTPLAPAAADIQGALGSLASGELSVGGKDDDDDLEDEEDAGDAEVAEEASVAPLSWCVTVQPDPSFSTEEFAKAGGRAGDFERWRGYWAARRRLRRLGTVGRTALQGRAWATQTSGQIG
ncbi:hypothetical protein BOX15_Mlig003299g2 [Macrostomum lignano]|uniref:PNPLA domain-containing protein n=1 Tax=Macrostomum lignano TaxID=282301 RepID=A0A267FUT9_9PLAT|nr:hypothetical protein BOX15_Mlig003299g2 [Macrostomum lignano]